VRVEYTREEMEALGLSKPRRQRRRGRSGPRLKLPVLPPVVWLGLGAVALTLATLLVHPAVTVKDRADAVSSQTTIGEDGTLKQTSFDAAGVQYNLETRNYGWPLIYAASGCQGTGPECQPYVHVSWSALLAALVFWFIPVGVVWFGYRLVTRGRR